MKDSHFDKFNYECDGQEDLCDICANRTTELCMICEMHEFYRTREQKEWEDMLCDMMCPSTED